jgi:hypothetical protein
MDGWMGWWVGQHCLEESADTPGRFGDFLFARAFHESSLLASTINRWILVSQRDDLSGNWWMGLR